MALVQLAERVPVLDHSPVDPAIAPRLPRHAEGALAADELRRRGDLEPVDDQV
jgi:hypothetical protein